METKAAAPETHKPLAHVYAEVILTHPRSMEIAHQWAIDAVQAQYLVCPDEGLEVQCDMSMPNNYSAYLFCDNQVVAVVMFQ